MVNAFRRARTLAFVSVIGAIALLATAIASAGPPSVNLTAASCTGSGQSYLPNPSGYTRTDGGCGQKYLAGRYVRDDGVEGIFPGTSSSSSILFGNLGNVSPVAAADGTHAIQYITSFSGYHQTNTW